MKPFLFRPQLWAAGGPFVLALLLTGCGQSDSAQSAERKVLYYQSAMHPWVKSDKPGRCTVCGMELTPIYEGESGLETGGAVIALSSNSIHVLHVQSAEVRRQPLTRTLRFAGTIEADETKRRVIAATAAGRIEKLHVGYVGAEVKAGEPLADFYSPMLLAAARDYLVVQRSANGQAALPSAAANRLLQLGLTDEQIEHLPHTFREASFVLPLLAPVSGTVIERNVLAGQYVGEGERLFTLADFSTVWLQFLAHEPDLPWLRPGLTAAVTTAAHPGETFTGTIAFLDPNLDPVTRAARVRVELDNPLANGRRRFANRLYAEAAVQLEAPEVPAIRRSAVLQSGPVAVAFVDAGGGAFERRELRLGRRGDSLVEVLNGLSEGERVVVQGNLLLDGQAEMNRIFAAPAPPAPAADSPALPPLTARQRTALTNLFQLVSTLATVLAADDLAAFHEHATHTAHVTGALTTAFPEGEWQKLVRPLETAAQLPAAPTLPEARKSFRPFSDAAVALAQAARRADAAFAELKIYRCPMTGDAFPGAPGRLDWLQLRGPLRNPWYGAEMLECGQEVKP